MWNTIDSTVVYLADYKPQTPVPILNIEDGLRLIRLSQVLTIDQIKNLYDRLSAHLREDFLAEVARQSDISDQRKSMLFQSAHFIENIHNSDTISLYLILGIYYWSQQEDIPMEILRVYAQYIKRAWKVWLELCKSLIMDWLRSEPWKFSGNLRTQMITKLRVLGRAQK